MRDDREQKKFHRPTLQPISFDAEVVKSNAALLCSRKLALFKVKLNVSTPQFHLNNVQMAHHNNAWGVRKKLKKPLTEKFNFLLSFKVEIFCHSCIWNAVPM